MIEFGLLDPAMRPEYPSNGELTKFLLWVLAIRTKQRHAGLTGGRPILGGQLAREIKGSKKSCAAVDFVAAQPELQNLVHLRVSRVTALRRGGLPGFSRIGSKSCPC